MYLFKNQEEQKMKKDFIYAIKARERENIDFQSMVDLAEKYNDMLQDTNVLLIPIPDSLELQLLNPVSEKEGETDA